MLRRTLYAANWMASKNQTGSEAEFKKHWRDLSQLEIQEVRSRHVFCFTCLTSLQVHKQKAMVAKGK